MLKKEIIGKNMIQLQLIKNEIKNNNKTYNLNDLYHICNTLANKNKNNNNFGQSYISNFHNKIIPLLIDGEILMTNNMAMNQVDLYIDMNNQNPQDYQNIYNQIENLDLLIPNVDFNDFNFQNINKKTILNCLDYLIQYLSTKL